MEWIGKRIKLRRPRVEDRDVIYEKWASVPEVTTYMAWPTHRSHKDCDAFLVMSDAMWDEYGCGPMIIEDRESGEIIGSAGLMFDGSDEVGVGYILSKEHWGQGYATEALELAIVGARDQAIEELVCGIHPAHIASRRVAQKCGFTLSADQPSSRLVFPQIDSENEGYTVRYILVLDEAREDKTPVQ